MASSFDKYQKRKLISSYVSVVISIALVLFLLGCLGLLVINSKKVADHFKEQVVMTIDLNDTAKEVEVNQLKKSLVMADYTKEALYVSKEEAAEYMKAQNGEDFMDFVGYNPLKNSIEVYLNADFVTTEKLTEITESLSNKAFVEDIRYDNDLVELMNENVKKITLWVLIISGLFTLIAVLLINSSIRLAVYSKRFIIKTMQMVGATKTFIRRPFVWKSVQLGIIGALVALAGMAVVLYYLDITFPELELLRNTITIVRKQDNKAEFIFGKKNYKFLFIGLAFIAIGFILMAGGGSDDPNVYDPSIFSWRRIRLAPTLVLIGFGIQVYAILLNPNKDSKK